MPLQELTSEPVNPVHAAPELSEESAALVARIRAGDREAAALFLEINGPLIRRRARGKLSPAMKRLFDSQEMLSTLARRLDRYVRAGRVLAQDESQLWALLFKMVDAAMVDKARVVRRLKSTEGEDSEFARRMLTRIEEADRAGDEGAELQIDSAFRALPTETDRQILSFWLNGVRQDHIGEYLGLTHDAVRQRWQSIRRRLRQSLEQGAA